MTTPTSSEIIDQLARKAGIPSETEFIQDVARLFQKPEARRTARERQILAQVAAFSRIRQDLFSLSRPVYVAVLFNLLLTFYGKLPLESESADLRTAAKRYADGLLGQPPATRQARLEERVFTLLMRSDLADSVREAGLRLLIDREADPVVAARLSTNH